MTRRQSIAAVMLALLLCVSMVAPAAALGGTTGASTIQEESGDETTEDPAEGENSATGQDRGNASVGGQLSTVVTATNGEIQSEFEDAAFEVEYESADENNRVTSVAERTATLSDRAATIRSEYEAATEAYQNDEITRERYAQRIAVLNGEASNVEASLDRVEERAAELDEVDLAAEGTTQSQFDDARTDVRAVTGSGATALFQQFTGEQNGEFEIDVENGLEIEVENDDGERTREFERPRTGNGSIQVSQSEALDTARDLLSETNGTWRLVDTEIDTDDGVYEFEFELRGGESGEAEIAIDASNGEAFEFEEEIEAADEDDEADEADEDDEESELSLLVADGTPAIGEEITLLVLVDGEPAADIAVEGEDGIVGTTDADGTLVVTVYEDAEFEVEHGDAEAELEFDLEDDDDDDREEGALDVDLTSNDDGSATLTATYNGSPVSDATVELDDDIVGTTDADGQLTFQLPADEEFDIEVERGELEFESDYRFVDGSLSVVADDDEDEAEDDEDEEDDDALDATVSYEDGVVTVSVTHDGEPVEGATVEANDNDVGTTDADGTISFDMPEDDELDLEIEHGELDFEGEYELEDGTLISEQSEEAEDEDAEDEESEEAEDEDAEDEESEEADDEEAEDEESEEDDEDDDEDDDEESEDEEADDDDEDDDDDE